MTDFSDVSVGDRVRLTHENGDFAEFTVVSLSDRVLYNAQGNCFIDNEGWCTEILERAAEKLPTGHLAVVGKRNRTPFILLSGGWVDLEGDKEAKPTDDEMVRRYIRRHGFEVLYEGIQ